MTAQLAILPTSPHTTPSKVMQRRPKLSLNTADTAPVRSLGKGSSLRLETLSAVSPTARNTFSNGYDPHALVAATAAAERKTDSPSSASAFSSSASAGVPYKLPHNVQSILSNSPLPPVHRRRTTAQRPMFPPAKHVGFCPKLTEDIVTTKYTMAHSDLASSPVSAAPNVVGRAATTKLDLQLCKTEAPYSTADTEYTMQRSRCPKRESSSDSESDGESCPVTPVAGRCKRQREWVWTLGAVPLDSSQQQQHLAGRRPSDTSEEGSASSSPTSSIDGETR